MAQDRQLGIGQQGVAQRGQNIGVATTNQENQRKNNLGVAGGVGSLIGGVLKGVSDERAKEDIREITPHQMSALLEHLTPHVFRYKGSNKPSIGVMAQDVQKGGPAGAAIVHEGEDGMLRIGGTESPALGVVLAELGALHDRIAHLEGRKR
jgi:hypothetical protein